MASFVETGTILDRILSRTASDVAERKHSVSRSELERMAAGRPAPTSLMSALSRPGVQVIAEFKRASPSRGRFPVEADPDHVATQYFDGGAAAMSVLTDEPFFQGNLADLRSAAEVAHALADPRPILRKDFVLDEYQVLEALAYGADAVLLIVAALDQPSLIRLSAAVAEHGLDALVEVHDEEELERAVDAGAVFIGINNRNLHTFEVDLSVTERLGARASKGAAVVSESGIFTCEDVKRVHAAGADAVLVGESLITAPDRAAAVRALATAALVG